MKKELSPGVILGAIIGFVVALVVGAFILIKSDPASQPPHESPRFDAGAKAEESGRSPYANRPNEGPNPAPARAGGDPTLQ